VFRVILSAQTGHIPPQIDLSADGMSQTGHNATSATKARELTKINLPGRLFAISRNAMIATKIICLSDVVSDGSSLAKADPWDGFAGSRKTAAETF
jgi:hypothetical protein